MKESEAFFGPQLPQVLVQIIQGNNPWWTGKASLPLSPFKRSLFPRLIQRMEKGITPAVVLRGPRRVGKTVLLRQMIGYFLEQGMAPERILYVPFDELETLRKLDEPILTTAYWFEKNILGKTFN